VWKSRLGCLGEGEELPVLRLATGLWQWSVILPAAVMNSSGREKTGREAGERSRSVTDTAWGSGRQGVGRWTPVDTLPCASAVRLATVLL